MNYRDPEIFGELASRFDWERKKGPRDPYKLDRMRNYAERADHPHQKLKGVYHLAGSKGKGSTSLFLARLLESLGHKSGLYTSPHLRFWSERITRAGQFWEREAYESALGEALNLATHGETVFEILTLAAWLLFLQQNCDRVVLEVGLGGRLDATNLVMPYRCLITRLELEHTDVLGSTLAEIAAEKAGIVKEGVPVWTYDQQPEALEVLTMTARERRARLMVLEQEYELNLKGDESGVWVQMRRSDREYEWRQPNLSLAIARNAALALATVLEAEGEGSRYRSQLLESLQHTSMPARMEWIVGDPPILLDGAHTPESTAELVAVIQRLHRPVILLYGCNEDKDVKAMVRQLRDVADRVVLTQSLHPRSLPAFELASLFGADAEVIEEPDVAFHRARNLCDSRGIVVVTGSLYLAAAVRELIEAC